MTTEERLEKLEKELDLLYAAQRRDRITLVCLGVILFCGWNLWPQLHGDHPQRIRAEIFEVVDKDGVSRALLSGFDGAPGLLLTGKNGKHTSLIVDAVGKSALYLGGESGVASLSAGGEEGAGAALVLMDQSINASAALAANQNGVSLGLINGGKAGEVDNKSIAGAWLSAGPASAEMGLNDRHGSARTSSSLHKDQGPGVALSDTNGKTTWSTP